MGHLIWTKPDQNAHEKPGIFMLTGVERGQRLWFDGAGRR
jgi:hypothetical protein